jgi:hypothetical protein
MVTAEALDVVDCPRTKFPAIVVLLTLIGSKIVKPAWTPCV